MAAVLPHAYPGPQHTLCHVSNNLALFVQHLSAFTNNFLVLQPMLKVASCGTWQEMALAVGAMEKRLCRVLDSKRALLDFVCTGKADDVEASGLGLTELVRTGRVQGATDQHQCQTNWDARDTEDLDAVSKSSEDDRDAEQVTQPMIAKAAAINAAAPILAHIRLLTVRCGACATLVSSTLRLHTAT
jgi:hypothetical protein